jgi:hypothetical protein
VEFIFGGLFTFFLLVLGLIVFANYYAYLAQQGFWALFVDSDGKIKLVNIVAFIFIVPLGANQFVNFCERRLNRVSNFLHSNPKGYSLYKNPQLKLTLLVPSHWMLNAMNQRKNNHTFVLIDVFNTDATRIEFSVKSTKEGFSQSVNEKSLYQFISENNGIIASTKYTNYGIYLGKEIVYSLSGMKIKYFCFQKEDNIFCFHCSEELVQYPSPNFANEEVFTKVIRSLAFEPFGKL